MGTVFSQLPSQERSLKLQVITAKMVRNAPKSSQLELKLILLIDRLRRYNCGRCKRQLSYPGKGQGDRGERESVFQRLGYDTNTSSSQGARAFRDRARSVPVSLPLERAGASEAPPEQRGRGEKELVHPGRDAAGCSSGSRGEAAGVRAHWRLFFN